MRILYGVQGEGMGHAMRAGVVLTELVREHDVRVVASGRGFGYLAESVPNGNGKLLLLPGLGHVPHLEAPDKVLPPLVAFLKEGAASGSEK